MEESESYPRSAVFGRTETPEAGRSPRLVGDQLGEFRVPVPGGSPAGAKTAPAPNN